MKMRAVTVASGLLVAGALASIINQGCGDDAQDVVEAARLARKGEACQSTADCVAGLACLPASTGGGVCVLGAFSVPQTGKECAIVECKEATDCCGPPPANCDNLLALCNADAGVTSQQACLNYQAQCVCSTTKFDCEASKCVRKCTEDTECTSVGLRRCVGGKCQACATDTDCGGPNSPLKCINAKCQGPCEGDGDCPGFERCINQQCQQGACQTNRECVAATRNVEATCGTDGKCIVPCTTDLECGNPKNFKFFSCISGQCMYLGCDSDKDCRLALEGAIGSSTSSSSSSSSSSSTSSSSSGGIFSPQQHVVCREKQTPGTTTIPSQ